MIVENRQLVGTNEPVKINAPQRVPVEILNEMKVSIQNPKSGR